MHKVVNGIKVAITEEEEAVKSADWEENRLKKAEKRIREAEEKQVRDNALNKIYDMANLSKEEIAVLKL